MHRHRIDVDAATLGNEASHQSLGFLERGEAPDLRSYARRVELLDEVNSKGRLVAGGVSM